MDTNQIISLLNGRVSVLTSQISALQNELDINKLAVQQLQGTLQTQLLSLTDEQVKSFPTVATIISENNALKTKVDELTVQLSAPVTETTTII